LRKVNQKHRLFYTSNVTCLSSNGSMSRGKPRSDCKQTTSRREEEDLTYSAQGLVDVIEKAIHVTKDRISNYKSGGSDSPSFQQLHGMLSYLELRRDEALQGTLEPSNRGQLMLGPLRMAMDWGEPDSSPLKRLLVEMERFYQENS
jgi:hypothetical protein